MFTNKEPYEQEMKPTERRMRSVEKPMKTRTIETELKLEELVLTVRASSRGTELTLHRPGRGHGMHETAEQTLDTDLCNESLNSLIELLEEARQLRKSR